MKRVISLLICSAILLCLMGCNKIDSEYAESSSEETSVVSEVEKEPVSDESSSDENLPAIKSDDNIMPTYIDISLYDEENYANIYLGEDFKYDVKYDGVSIGVPMTYDELLSKGWIMVPSTEYNEESNILEGKSLWVEFVNSNGKKLMALFYNSGLEEDDKALVSIKNCPVVKFAIKENLLINAESSYGEFTINGVSNGSVITDIIETLGSPSHFYRVSDNHYYLDWFITAKDRRSEITIYINTLEDHIEAVEFSYYQ